MTSHRWHTVTAGTKSKVHRAIGSSGIWESREEEQERAKIPPGRCPSFPECSLFVCVFVFKEWLCVLEILGINIGLFSSREKCDCKYHFSLYSWNDCVKKIQQDPQKNLNAYFGLLAVSHIKCYVHKDI